MSLAIPAVPPRPEYPEGAAAAILLRAGCGGRRVRGSSGSGEAAVRPIGSRPLAVGRSPAGLTVYTRAGDAGGGFLRTGCGPGPLEPDLGNPSEGNAKPRCPATAAP